jgi:hypothetical protein
MPRSNMRKHLAEAPRSQASTSTGPRATISTRPPRSPRFIVGDLGSQHAESFSAVRSPAPERASPPD